MATSQQIAKKHRDNVWFIAETLYDENRDIRELVRTGAIDDADIGDVVAAYEHIKRIAEDAIKAIETPRMKKAKRATRKKKCQRKKSGRNT